MWDALANTEQETKGMESSDQETGHLEVWLKLYLWVVCYQSLEAHVSYPKNVHLQRNLYLKVIYPSISTLQVGVVSNLFTSICQRLEH